LTAKNLLLEVSQWHNLVNSLTFRDSKKLAITIFFDCLTVHFDSLNITYQLVHLYMLRGVST